MSFATIEADFEHRLDQCWLSIMVADIGQLSSPHGWNTMSRDVRAAAAVFAMAEFEGLLKDVVEELHSVIEQSGHPVSKLCDGVRMLHFDSRFTAAANVSSLDSAWSTRRELASTHTLTVAPALPRRDPRGFLQPVGSRTPRPTTLTRLWLIYGLAGMPFPRLAWQKALGELADIRNDVAHRRDKLTSAMAGQGRAADAVAQYTLDLRDLGKHVAGTFDQYASTSAFVA